MMGKATDRDADIAIIGMAGRFPGATTLDQFWRNLRDGVNSISYFSKTDLEQAGVAPATLADPAYVRASPILQDVDKFDAAFFGYSPREAKFIDPQQRILLECAWEALEQAGYSTKDYPYPIGIYAGSSLNTYFLYSGLHTHLAREFVLALSSSDKDFLATRIAHKLNLQGPAITVQTACSTSLVAVHMACQSLFTGECDMMLAGGVSVKVPQQAGYFWKQGGIVSRDGHVRTFDAKATGTVFGSAAGIVVLKRLPDAIRDGDFIHAVIKGSAINNDGSAKASFTAPSIVKQAEVVVEALARSGVSAEMISYVEAHGTGTPLGDPIEIDALTKAFRSSTQKTGFCAIGSVKPNIGHAEAASGIVSLIKTVLALENEAIPPSVDFEQSNPNIDFEHSPFFVNHHLMSWPRGAAPRHACINSLGVGGTNAHVVLQEAPVAKASGPGRMLQVIPISAKTSAALQDVRKNLRESFERSPETEIADAAFTLQVGRRHFEYRDFVVCGSSRDAVSCLASHSSDAHRGYQRGNHPVFIFPSEVAPPGSNVSEVYEREPLFRQQVDRCWAVLRQHFVPGLAPYFWYAEQGSTGEVPRVQEIVTFVVEYGLAQLWISWGVHPGAVVGDGLGEITAACIAGALSLENALQRVCRQTELKGAERHTQSSPAGETHTSIPCLVTTTGTWLTGEELASPGGWLGQRRLPSRYPETIRALLSQNARIFLELGSGGEISKLLKQAGLNSPDSPFVLTSLPGGDANESQMTHLVTSQGELWMAGIDVDWNRVHEADPRRRIPLPTYPFQRNHYWWEATAPADS